MALTLTKRNFDLRLIELVRENPILYDPKNESHMNYDQREVVWQKIGDILNKPSKFCRRRWANIRDLLRKRIKLRRSNQDAYPYKYERELSFYIPLVNERDAKREPYDDDHNSLNENNDKYDILHEVFVEPDNNTADLLPPEFKRPDRNVTLDPRDPLDVFLLTLGSTLKKLSPYYMNQAKSKLFQVVQEYELKQIMEIEHRNVLPNPV